MLYVVRAYVFFAALVSAALTIRLFADWPGQSLPVAIALGGLIEAGKLMCEYYAIKLWPRGVKLSTCALAALAICLLGLSALATQVCLSSMDDKFEKSSLINSVEYQTLSSQIASLTNEVSERRNEAEARSLRGDDKGAGRLLVLNASDLERIAKLSEQLRNIKTESPIKHALAFLGDTSTPLSQVYWLIAFVLEFCRVAGLLVLNSSAWDWAKNVVRKDDPSTLPLSQSKWKGLRVVKNELEELCERVEKALSEGVEPNYKAMAEALNVPNRKLAPVFDRLRERGILRKEGNRHVLAS